MIIRSFQTSGHHCLGQWVFYFIGIYSNIFSNDKFGNRTEFLRLTKEANHDIYIKIEKMKGGNLHVTWPLSRNVLDVQFIVQVSTQVLT